MLYLDAALELEGVTVYRDFNDPTLFYYMPRAPRLKTEGGQPMFQLLIYRRDITDNPDFKTGDREGGGFLTMTVNLEVPKATVDAAKTALGALVPGGGTVNLTPVPFENGSVRVSALGMSVGKAAVAETGEAAAEGGGTAVAERGPRFVEKMLAAARPSLYNDNAAVFTIELSHEGALLMRASLEDAGASQIAVIYDLEFRGLLPAYEATIVIETKQVYDYLRNRFQVNTLWFKSDIDAEVEKLLKDQHISIKDVDYLGLDPAKAEERRQRLDALAKELATWTFFKPGLTPGKVLADDRGNITAYDATEDAKKNERGFTQPLAAAGTGRGSPGDIAGPRVPADSANPATTRVGGTAPPPATTAPSGGDTSKAPEAGNAVEAWNKMGRPQSAYLMRSLSQQETQRIEYNLRQVAAAKRSIAPQGSIRLMPGAASLRGRIKEVDLNDQFFQKISGTVTTSADLEAAGVTSMVVKIRYGLRDDGTVQDTKEFPLTKKDDKGTYEFFMDRRKTINLEYQVVVTYKAGFAVGGDAVQSTSPWISTSTRNLDVDPRLVGAAFPVTLVAGTIDWDNVQSVRSVVIYDDAGVHDERTVLLSKAEPTKTVPVMPPPNGSRKYKVKTTFQRAASEEVVEVEDDGDATIVINPPAGRVVPVSLSLADPLSRLRKVTAELAYLPAAGQPEQTKLVELTGDGSSGSWSFVRTSDAGGVRYRYRVTEFGKDGTTNTGDWQETAERQLIVGDRFEGLLDVEVRFLVPDFPTLGFMGAKIKLEYPDAPPHTKASLEKFITASADPVLWKVPMRRGGGRQYQYTVQWVRTAGALTTVGPVTTEDQLLLVLPPAGN